MAEERSRIILEVGLDPAQYAQRANEIAKTIDNLKKQQADLRKEGQLGSVQYTQNAQQLRALQSELKANVTLMDQAANSNNALRAQLSILTAEYNAMSIEQKRNTEEGQRLQKQIKAISDTLKEEESAIGDNRRNVGNYRDAVKGLEGQLGALILQYESLDKTERKSAQGKELQDKIESVTEALKNETEALKAAEEAQKKAEAVTVEHTKVNATFSESLKDIISEYIPFNGELLSGVKNFLKLTGSIDASSKSLRVLKVALISTGIGAILVLIGSLIAYLSKSQTAIDKVKQVLSGLGAVLDVVFDRFADFGSGIVKLFTGDLKGALEDFRKSVKGIGEEMAIEFKQAMAIAKGLQDIEKAESRLNVERAKSKARISELKFISEDVTKSEKTRLDATKQALGIEQNQLNESIRLQKEKIRLMKEQLSMTKATEADYEEVRQAEIELYGMQEESTEKQIELNNKINSIRQETAQKAQETLEKQKELEKEYADSVARTAQITMTARQREVDDLIRSFQEQIELHKNNHRLVEQLVRERDARLVALRKQFQEEDLVALRDNLRTLEDIQISSIKNQGERELAELKVNHQRRLEQQDETITDLAERIQAGEEGLTEVWESALKVRDALESEYERQRTEKLKEQADERVLKAKEEALRILEARASTAGTDQERLLAEQAYLDASYQLQIDAALRAGQDTTAIKMEYEAQKRALDKETNDLALQNFNSFSTSFQTALGKNSRAAKIAADVQTRANAALQLQNNILIIQEQVKAVASQGKLLWPLNLVAITSTLAALGAGIVAARNLFKPMTTEVPGYSGGGQFISDGKGTVLPGYSKTDNINAKLRSGEGIIVSEAMRVPSIRNLLSTINTSFGGRDFSVPGPTPHFASGGIFDGGLTRAFATQNADNTLASARMIMSIIRGLPTPVVSVKEIISASEQVNNIEVKRTI
ncbi:MULTISPECIES: hypothetical protein [Olivibacter]|uniref:Chromosome segregation ATPase n=1 Tax=Olivibacter jilunii TaxID=985016 RepID=A0ABW6AZI8_9SPHI